jgi:NADH dehydrogenase
LVEQYLFELGVPYSVLRPAVLFGDKGILLNNIAWLLRNLPVFAIGGDGRYRVRAVHVGDLARLCVQQGVLPGALHSDTVMNAVGPERPTFLELVTCLRAAVGSRARIARVPGTAMPPLSRVLGFALHDVLLTGDEYKAMAAGLADVEGPATGDTAVSEWIEENGSTLGLDYFNELDRHYRR